MLVCYTTVVVLQVCTYDLWDRMTTEGYGWLQLGPPDGSGSCTHYVDTWKPLGEAQAAWDITLPPARAVKLQCWGCCLLCADQWTYTYGASAGSRRDQQQAFFIGGSEELQDMSYVAVPRGHKGPVLNKYGYKTQVSGNVKVRAAAASAGCYLFASDWRPTTAAPPRVLQTSSPACCPLYDGVRRCGHTWCCRLGQRVAPPPAKQQPSG